MDFRRLPRVTAHRCTPVSDKVALCKMDLIGIGVIIFTIFFLLVCLERIVKLIRRLCTRAREQDQHEEAQSSTESEATLMDSGASIRMPSECNSRNDVDGQWRIPLYRCLERSESAGAKYTEQNDVESNASRPLLPATYTDVFSANTSFEKPCAAHTREAKNFTLSVPASLTRDATTFSISSADSFFGSPPRSSTPPPFIISRELLRSHNPGRTVSMPAPISA